MAIRWVFSSSASCAVCCSDFGVCGQVDKKTNGPQGEGGANAPRRLSRREEKAPEGRTGTGHAAAPSGSGPTADQEGAGAVEPEGEHVVPAGHESRFTEQL